MHSNCSCYIGCLFCAKWVGGPSSFSNFLRVCVTFAVTQLRRLTDSYVVTYSDSLSFCNFMFQKLRLPMLQVIVQSAEFLMQWDEFVQVLFLLWLLTSYLFHFLMTATILCNSIRLILLNFLTATMHRYARLLWLGLRMTRDMTFEIGLLLGL